MTLQRTAGTGPELALRRELHALGLRFRVQLRLEGTRPDIVFTRARIAVFVMGDFWHSCPLHGTRPKANAQWWAEKLDANRARDLRQHDTLTAAGWRVIWVWECEDPVVAARAVRDAWRVTGPTTGGAGTGSPGV
jgi:DNA mismatch endonuclease (patch repair protein)